MGELLSLLLGIGGGGLLTKEALDRLQSVGSTAKTEATGLANEIKGMTQFKPFTVTSATGSSFGAKAGENGTEVDMNLSIEEQAMQNALFRDSKSFFDQAAMDPAERERQIYSRIRAAQDPGEQRARMALESRLNAQGRGGIGSALYGGTPEQLSMDIAQSEARNNAMLTAMQQAQTEQNQLASLGQQYQAAAYMPQAQLLNVQQAASLYPQMQQQAQLYGAGQYGETMLSGIEAQLLAEQAQANLYGSLGSGLLSGMFTPVAQAGGGATNALTTLLGKLF